ncbi:sulfate ABC transporter substrate-binding protein [Petralouisia muris]|uniref:Sulfate ABC transporter substrate-binding protein n=1 Tax=Petralouisia muris TaxID=3032872 RepID=A0AC61RZK1_9FIRM|nr:sulfate ABC transporter substrate-binding protein [Petralouisia muris]TGY97564.1 sulfate ABC transporter substrate-binding protein [Petralouisia muris]
MREKIKAFLPLFGPKGQNCFGGLGKKTAAFALCGILAASCLAGCGDGSGSDKKGDGTELLNVSYDPTREFYAEYNDIFCKYWKEQGGSDVTVTQSHGGSGSQARSVIEGNEADVVTLALAHDITAIENSGMIEEGWSEEFEGDSAPYTSTIVFLVRKGNEKNIKDWDDLVKDGVEVITPNPKTSGGACWNFLAAWAYEQQNGKSEQETEEFLTKLYQNVLVLDSGARGATNTFVENRQGDVLIAWENEAYLSLDTHPDEYEIVTPSVSILAQPSVAVVDKYAKDHGTEELAAAYLEHLYSDEAQRLAGKHHYRPSNEEILQEFSDKFDLEMNLVTIDDFGGWDKAYETYFQDGAVFDQIYTE